MIGTIIIAVVGYGVSLTLVCIALLGCYFEFVAYEQPTHGGVVTILLAFSLAITVALLTRTMNGGVF